MFRDYHCLLLQDYTGEPITNDLPRGNHEASLLTIQLLFGWVSNSEQFVKALARSHLPEPALTAHDRKRPSAGVRIEGFDCPRLSAKRATPGQSSGETSAASAPSRASPSPTRTPPITRSGAISASGDEDKARLNSSGWGSVSFSLFSEMSP